MGENLDNGECSGQFCLLMSQPENGSLCFAVKNYINLTHLGIKYMKIEHEYEVC